MDLGRSDTCRLLEGEQELEASLVELVIAASECSEDAWEIADRLDSLLASGRVKSHP